MNRSIFKRVIIPMAFAMFVLSNTTIFGQIYNQSNFGVNQPGGFFTNSSVFKQEIARLEINVAKTGKDPLPITQVPRLEKDDVLKIRLLEEPVNSIKIDQTNFDWTLVVAYINPGRNSDKTKTVSEEINFRKKGWYKEHTLTVPYDCQPIFFLYPKPEYRSKILNLINKDQETVRKIGEKTIEIADAYAKIGMFLNELQDVVNRNYYRGMYSNYNYGYTYGGSTNLNTRNFGYNDSLFAEQAIERIARSFNIQMPSCWGGNQYNPYGSYSNGNNGYYNNPYNTGYNNYYSGGYGASNDLVGRVQCLARTVRVEDFDISLSQMIQQGGIFAAAQLTQKYPQIAFWINIAAAALDFIIKITNRAPLKIVPTVVASSPTQSNMMMIQNNLPQTNPVNSGKISLFAENAPTDRGFVTAYPLVFHKWQADADPNVINMPLPVLANSCLHAGQNIIRTTDVLNDWIKDNFNKEFQLTLTAGSDYKKEFELKKNIGFGGWELSISKDELSALAKSNSPVKGVVTGKRGFNKIQSDSFDLPLSTANVWSVEQKSQDEFTIGGKRKVVLKSQGGDCRCLEAVVFKTAQGQEMVFDAKKIVYSPDGKEISFEIDATNLEEGVGQLELQLYGGESNKINLNLYPSLPNISGVKIAKSDTQIKLIGEGLEQIKSVTVNGKKAVSANNVVSQLNQKEKTFYFEKAAQFQEASSFALEMELNNQRVFKSPVSFTLSSSRPLFVANEAKEIDGTAASSSSSGIKSLPVFSLEEDKVTVDIQNSLTDYDFKVENLTIETRVENTDLNPFPANDVSFEVYDWRSLRVKIQLTEQSRKFLGGRRIQFRVIDSKRGESDWYSIKQTFVRMPQVNSINCTTKECQITGKGLNYIYSLSLDDGKIWFPGSGAGLTTKSIENGLETATIPYSPAHRIIKVKLRDFPMSDGIVLSVGNK